VIQARSDRVSSSTRIVFWLGMGGVSPRAGGWRFDP
jgi:hypothetical protein